MAGAAPASAVRTVPPIADLVPPRVVQSDLDAEIRAYLEGLSVAQLVCLAYGHRWPELIPGTKIPKGFHTVPDPQVQGVYLVTEDCIRRSLGRSCGTVRKSMTLPRGFFDRNVQRSYGYDNGPGGEWAIRPDGSGLTRRDFLDQIYRQMGRELFPAEYGEGK